MVTPAYIVPVLACLLLHFGLGYRGEWQTYMWVFVCGEATVGLLHWAFYRQRTSATEYLGSMVCSVHYEEDWVELVTRIETRTDSRGRSYTVRKVDRIYHPEKYYYYTNIGSCYDTNSDFYSYIGELWGLPSRRDKWMGHDIEYGVRFGSHYTIEDFENGEAEDPYYCVPVTEAHRYKNKIRHSNSIFKYEKIDKERACDMGLIEYPPVDELDTPCILSDDYDVPAEAQEMFQKFNVLHAACCEMRLWVLLYRADRGVGVSEYQRAFWQGGHKNEFVVCIGVGTDGGVDWARVFSWADDQTKEVETARWLMDNPQFEWLEFYNWLSGHIVGWRRKEFCDFDYINVSLPLWQCLMISAVSVVENALVIKMLL